MMKLQLARLLFVLACALNCCHAIQWLGLYKLGSLVSSGGDRGDGLRSFCDAMKQQSIFGARQYKFCRRHSGGIDSPATMTALIKASQQTLALCQSQFQGFRWNCSVLEHVPKLAPELRSLTAEQALVHALSGFVLTTTFANDCAKGIISQCRCGKDPDWLGKKRPDLRFKFDGCHTNLNMGQKMAMRFLGAVASRRKRGRKRGVAGRRRSAARGRAYGTGGGIAKMYRKFARMVNTHNYRVGIKVTRHSEAVRCKCHGSSASCTIRTCYKVLHRRGYQVLDAAYVRKSDQDPIDILLNMYDKQKLRKTVFDESGYQGYEEQCTDADRAAGNPLAAKPKCEAYKVVRGLPESDVLLFHEHSLDYCTMRERIYPGTHNRECLPDRSREAANILTTDSGDRRREILCSVMCCGRPYRNSTVSYPGSHPDCQAKSCRLLQNPFRVDCQPCVLTKSFCS